MGHGRSLHLNNAHYNHKKYIKINGSIKYYGSIWIVVGEDKMPVILPLIHNLFQWGIFCSALRYLTLRNQRSGLEKAQACLT